MGLSDVSSPRFAPGPRGGALRNLRAFRSDVLGLILRLMREYGDLVRVQLGPLDVHLVTHPELVRVVLKDTDGYDKNTLTSRMIRPLTGASILIENGARWQANRRLMQPAFAPGRMLSFLPLVVAEAEAVRERWRASAASGAPLDVASEMMRVTYRVVEGALFSTRTDAGLGELEQAITATLEFIYGGVRRGFHVPSFLPTATNLRFRRALAVLDRRVQEIIDDHRRSPRDDLLGRLLLATDEQGGRRLDDRELRDEVITLLTAGHETTANGLTWLWYLLAEHPAVAERVRQELASVLGGRPPAAQDLPRLAFTTMVIQEGLRLYTPIWAIVRRSARDNELGGCTIPAGARVVVSPYATHRHPGFWESPEEFRPERFAPERAAALHPYAYIPFGAGGRVCIGQHLASLEALVITAVLAQAWRLRLVPGHLVEMDPGITLRAKHGMRMLVEPAG
jgi:cytochrome P450